MTLHRTTFRGGCVRTYLPLVVAAAISLVAVPNAAAAERGELDQVFRRKLDQLASQCDNVQLPDQARKTREWFPERDPGRLYLFLRPRFGAVAEPRPRPPTAETCHQRFMEYRREHAAGLFELAKQAIADGRGAEAYQLLHEVLHNDPLHKEAGRIIGKRSADRPLRAVKGRSTDRRFGWRRGRYWHVESPHFIVTTDVNGTAGRDLARQLEELHSIWRQVFFRHWSSAEALKARFAGRANSLGKRVQHRVVLFRDRDEYIEKLTRVEPMIGKTLGYYMKDEEKSFLHAGGRSLQKTWFHEVVHQLFQETGGTVAHIGERWNFWLVEGVAMYFESLVRHDNYFTLGGFDADRLQYARARRHSGEFYMPVAELTRLGRADIQEHPDIGRIYSQSAGLVHFLMNHKGGRFRGRFIELTELVCQGRDPSDALATVVGEPFDRIDELYTESIQVDDDLLQFLDRQAELKNLCLSRTLVTNDGLAHLKELRQLEWLDLSFTRVTDRGLESLGNLPNLRRLDLQGSQISGESLKWLLRFPQLEELDLSGTPLTDRGGRDLLNAGKLKVLWLADTKITDNALELLAELPGLRQVDVAGTGVTDDAWSDFLQRLTVESNE